MKIWINLDTNEIKKKDQKKKRSKNSIRRFSMIKCMKECQRIKKSNREIDRNRIFKIGIKMNNIGKIKFNK